MGDNVTNEILQKCAKAYLDAMVSADITCRAVNWFGKSDCSVNTIGLKAALEIAIEEISKKNS